MFRQSSCRPQGAHQRISSIYGIQKHIHLAFFDAPPEDGNVIAETYVGVTNIPYFVNNSCALVGLT
jgi:hypothetical protein